MEIIEIRDSNASVSSIKNNNIRWNIYSKKMFKFFLIVYSVGIALLIYGIFNFNEFSRKSYSKFEFKTQIIQTNNYYSNWHISESIGIVMLFIAFVQSINYYNQKKIFFKNANDISIKLLETSNEILIKIDNEFVKYYSPDLNIEIKWKLISKYSIYNNHLLLYLDEGKQSILVIDKSLISLEEYNYLLAIINKKRVIKIN